MCTILVKWVTMGGFFGKFLQSLSMHYYIMNLPVFIGKICLPILSIGLKNFDTKTHLMYIGVLQQGSQGLVLILLYNRYCFYLHISNKNNVKVNFKVIASPLWVNNVDVGR